MKSPFITRESFSFQKERQRRRTLLETAYLAVLTLLFWWFQGYFQTSNSKSSLTLFIFTFPTPFAFLAVWCCMRLSWPSLLIACSLLAALSSWLTGDSILATTAAFTLGSILSRVFKASLTLDESSFYAIQILFWDLLYFITFAFSELILTAFYKELMVTSSSLYFAPIIALKDGLIAFILVTPLLKLMKSRL